MGHLRLGRLPRTRNWRQVLQLIGEGAGAPEIAAATLRASKDGLLRAADDLGVQHVFRLLAEITFAARGENFAEGLRRLGVAVPQQPGLFDVTSGFTAAIDSYLSRWGARTDLGEMAQLAAVEALNAKTMREAASIVGTSPADIKRAIKGFSTVNGFSSLAREFFTRFTKKYLGYFLSRELSTFVGRGERFQNIGEHEAFNAGLERHCHEAARIVEEFSGSWLSKARHEGGLVDEKVSGFLHIALKKLSSEFAARESSG